MASASNNGTGGSQRGSFKKREVDLNQSFMILDEQEVEDGAQALELALQQLNSPGCETGRCIHKEQVAELKLANIELEKDIREKGVEGAQKPDAAMRALQEELTFYEGLEVKNKDLVQMNSDLETENKALRETLENVQKQADWRLNYHLSAKLDTTLNERMVEEKLVQAEGTRVKLFSLINQHNNKARHLENLLKKVDADISAFLCEAVKFKEEVDKHDLASAAVPGSELQRQLQEPLNTLEGIIQNFKTDNLLGTDIVDQLEANCEELREFKNWLDMVPTEKIKSMCMHVQNCGNEIEWYEKKIKEARENLTETFDYLKANESNTEHLLGNGQIYAKAVQENFRVLETENVQSLDGLSKKLNACKILFYKLHNKFERMSNEFFSLGSSTFTEDNSEESVESEVKVVESEQRKLCTSCQRSNLEPGDVRKKQLASQNLQEFTYLLDNVERDLKRINKEEVRGIQKFVEHC